MKKLTKLLKWMARILSVVSITLLLLIVTGEPMNPAHLSIMEWFMFLFFPIGIILGMIIAWFRELLGSLISTVSLLIFYFLCLIGGGHFPSGPWFIIFTLPAIIGLMNSVLKSSKQSK